MRIEEDFFRKHVRGFYIKEDSLCFSSGDRVCRSSPSERKRYDTGKSEAVFKIISYAKSGKSVSNLLHYISEHSEGLEAPVEVIDDLGGVWNANDLSNAIRDFELDKDETPGGSLHYIIPERGGFIPRNDGRVYDGIHEAVCGGRFSFLYGDTHASIG